MTCFTVWSSPVPTITSTGVPVDLISAGGSIQTSSTGTFIDVWNICISIISLFKITFYDNTLTLHVILHESLAKQISTPFMFGSCTNKQIIITFCLSLSYIHSYNILFIFVKCAYLFHSVFQSSHHHKYM